MIEKEPYQECLEYIKQYWPKATFYFPREKGIHIGLPYKFVAPNAELFRNDQFYWDSYFSILGLIPAKKVALAKGMVDNLLGLYRRFNIIPMRNKLFNLGISQPPFLTSMILEVFGETKDEGWLLEAALVAEQELKNYWVAEPHLTESGLSRYCDHFWTHTTAEHESGWDMTSRFAERCLDYLPVDLNSLLYKYETDLAKIFGILGKKDKARKCAAAAEIRKQKINELMWNESKGFFFDYNHNTKSQSTFYSLAGFYPLWAGLVSKEQAEKMRKAVKKFEFEGGLANTQSGGLSKFYKQWDYPNGWAPQQFIVVDGLLKYGFAADAERIAVKWLDMNKKVFLETGKFWEKYNVVENSLGKTGRYPMQSGFGWTNAVFVRLLSMF
jgi:alpha,alpha-trehalase